MHLFACNAYTIYHCKSFACCCCCCYCVAVAVREINKRPWNIQLKPVKCNNCKAADATATRMWRNRSRSANEAMSTVVNAVCVSVRVCEWVMPAIDEAFAQIPLILFTRFFRCCCSCCAEVARWTCNTLQHTPTVQHIMGLMKTGEKRMKNNRTWTNTCHPFQLKFIARGKANTAAGVGRGRERKRE